MRYWVHHYRDGYLELVTGEAGAQQRRVAPDALEQLVAVWPHIAREDDEPPTCSCHPRAEAA